MPNPFYINNKRVSSSTDQYKSKEGQSVDSRTKNAWHMAADPGLYEPQRLNTFEFLIDPNAIPEDTKLQSRPDGNPGTIGEILDIWDKYGNKNKAQEALRLAVSSASIPSFSQGAIEVRRGNTVVKYAGTPQFTNGSITIHDYIGLPALEVIYAWQSLSFNLQTEKVGVAGDYKKTCYLMEYTPDYQLVRSWKLEGCWVSNVAEGQFNDASSDLNNVTVTIEYDRAYIDYRTGIDG